MTQTFVNSSLVKAAQLGLSAFTETSPIELWNGASEAEIEQVIQAVYRQVLGNTYVMENERLSSPESQLRNGEITVREFVRIVALSDLYRTRFIENCPAYRTIELNFKHLLGRAPESHEEMRMHGDILDKYGDEAEIDSYLDSDEYQDAFGENIVPYYRGYQSQTGKKVVGFTHLFKLLRGPASSDKDVVLGNYSRLNQSLIKNTPSGIIPPSTVDTYGGLTDIKKLLAQVLKPKIPTQTQTYEKSLAQTRAYQDLQRQSAEQEKIIEQLQGQLTELNSFANLGAIELNKWQKKGIVPQSETSLTPSFPTSRTPIKNVQASETFQSLQQRVEEQQQIITTLEAQIAQLKSLASIGEIRLNKWRNRTFR
jgi:hypothetical protein